MQPKYQINAAKIEVDKRRMKQILQRKKYRNFKINTRSSSCRGEKQ
jgi:hypothetical protein